MMSPQRKGVPFFVALLSVCLWHSAFNASKVKSYVLFQDTTEAAIKLYNVGKEHLKQGAYTEAIKEAESALKLQPERASFYLLRGQASFGLFEQEINDESNFTRSVISYDKLKGAIKDFKKYLELDRSATDADAWREQIRLLSLYAGVPNEDNAKRDIFLSSEVTTKARILSRPEPEFSLEARNSRDSIRGIVRLLVILGADGRVSSVTVLKPLPYGLAEKAVEAAGKIKFTPANKDARAVSQPVVIEYFFDLPSQNHFFEKPVF